MDLQNRDCLAAIPTYVPLAEVDVREKIELLGLTARKLNDSGKYEKWVDRLVEFGGAGDEFTARIGVATPNRELKGVERRADMSEGAEKDPDQADGKFGFSRTVPTSRLEMPRGKSPTAAIIH
jgi:hypothetical protein